MCHGRRYQLQQSVSCFLFLKHHVSPESVNRLLPYKGKGCFKKVSFSFFLFFSQPATLEPLERLSSDFMRLRRGEIFPIFNSTFGSCVEIDRQMTGSSRCACLQCKLFLFRLQSCTSSSYNVSICIQSVLRCMQCWTSKIRRKAQSRNYSNTMNPVPWIYSNIHC